MTDFRPLLTTTDAGPRPTVAIVGVGAIGTVVADALGERAAVTLCRRASTEPMSIQLGTRTHLVDAAVAGSPEGIAPVDWVVVTVKAQDTAAIGPWLDALVGPETIVVVLQNGIGHAERVREWAAPHRVVPGVVYIAAEKVGGNLVVCRKRGAVAIGGGPASERFAALFGESIDVRVVDDFVTESWNKLVINATLNTVTALTDSTMEITADAGVRPLVRALLAEAVEVARAEGAVMPDGSAEVMLDHMDALPRAGATSMLLDRRAGRALEHDYLTGAVLAAADRHGLPVPMLRMVHGLVDALDPCDRSAVDAVSLAA